MQLFRPVAFLNLKMPIFRSTLMLMCAVTLFSAIHFSLTGGGDLLFCLLFLLFFHSATRPPPVNVCTYEAGKFYLLFIKFLLLPANISSHELSYLFFYPRWQQVKTSFERKKGKTMFTLNSSNKGHFRTGTPRNASLSIQTPFSSPRKIWCPWISSKLIVILFNELGNELNLPIKSFTFQSLSQRSCKINRFLRIKKKKNLKLHVIPRWLTLKKIRETVLILGTGTRNYYVTNTNINQQTKVSSHQPDALHLLFNTYDNNQLLDSSL